jgi:hypothetical protein
MRRIPFISVAAIMSLGVAAHAQAPADKKEAAKPDVAATPKAHADAKPTAMPAPKPPAELEALKPFVGTWKCTGTGTNPVDKSEYHYAAKLSLKPELQNFWYAADYVQDKAKEGMPGFTGRGFMGYAAGQKKYLFAGFDTMGGSIHFTSAGPSGNTIEWTGEMDMGLAGNVPAKFTLTTGTGKDQNKLTFTAEANGQKLFTDECKK